LKMVQRNSRAKQNEKAVEQARHPSPRTLAGASFGQGTAEKRRLRGSDIRGQSGITCPPPGTGFHMMPVGPGTLARLENQANAQETLFLAAAPFKRLVAMAAKNAYTEVGSFPSTDGRRGHHVSTRVAHFDDPGSSSVVVRQRSVGDRSHTSPVRGRFFASNRSQFDPRVVEDGAVFEAGWLSRPLPSCCRPRWRRW
jgi:hypothetical protein